VKLIWTKNNLPLSILIRAVTGEDCSHFAFVFESQSQGLVFQSNLLGTGVEFFSKAQKAWGYKIVHQIDLEMLPEEEDLAWDIIVNNYSNVPYNFLGALYLGWAIILKRLFKITPPLKNLWGKPDTMFCDQVYKVLNGLSDPRLPKICVMNGMDTPYDIYLKVMANGTAPSK
jgi:hypothetical protein